MEQIRSAVDASNKVVWSVLFACISIWAVDWGFPDLFEGLPTWVIPLVRIVGIFVAVLALFSIFLWLAKSMSAVIDRISIPMKRNLIRKKLLGLSAGEVIILSMAVAKADRTVWVNPDAIAVISLQDMGLLERYFVGVVTSDGTSSFEIPDAVWRIIHIMEEFRLDNPKLLRSGDFHNFSETQIAAALPKKHPAIKSYIDK